MKKYIECEKLSKTLKIWQSKIAETYGKNDEYVKCLGSVLLGIDRIPAADVRPVVLCRDCVYLSHDKYGAWCINNYEANLKDDDFCSHGKRKEKQT